MHVYIQIYLHVPIDTYVTCMYSTYLYMYMYVYYLRGLQSYNVLPIEAHGSLPGLIGPIRGQLGAYQGLMGGLIRGLSGAC